MKEVTTSYMVLDVYRTCTFDTLEEAQQFATRCHEDLMRMDGMDRDEAAKSITIRTFITTNETMFDAMPHLFEDEQ